MLHSYIHTYIRVRPFPKLTIQKILGMNASRQEAIFSEHEKRRNERWS